MSMVGVPRSAIGRDDGAYRKGVVLGLTMAEIMLLLVFCLLIAAAVIFKHDREERIALRDKLDASDRALVEARKESRLSEAETRRLTYVLDSSGQDVAATAKLDDDWKKLVDAEETVRRMEAAGLVPEDVVTRAADIRQVETLLKRGMDGTQIVATVDGASKDEVWISAMKDLEKELSRNEKIALLSPAELVRLAALGAETRLKKDGEHDWPPIINLSEARGYSFATGRADLSRKFEASLRSSISADVLSIANRYGANVVEVIGHTDEQPMTPRPSNLDASLVPALGGKVTVNTLLPSDNAGLGMARAVSVARLLRSDPRFASLTVIPLSGGQMVMPGDVVTDGLHAGDASERRRIEIRIRRPESTSR